MTQQWNDDRLASISASSRSAWDRDKEKGSEDGEEESWTGGGVQTLFWVGIVDLFLSES
jgi:hypothetical protein